MFASIRVFSSELDLRIRWPKSWSFSFSVSPSNEYSGLISFRIDWFYLLAVQGTLKSLLQHHSSKPSILWCSACNEADLGSIPGLGRSPGGGHGNPIQYSCLEDPHGQRSLVGYSPWGLKESGTTGQLSTHTQPSSWSNSHIHT